MSWLRVKITNIISPQSIGSTYHHEAAFFKCPISQTNLSKKRENGQNKRIP